MKKPLLGILILGLFFALCLGLLTQPKILTPAAEKLLNYSLREYFDGSLRLKSMQINSHLALVFEGMTGTLKSTEMPFPLEVSRFESQGSVLRLFSKNGMNFKLEGIRPQNSANDGIQAEGKIRLGKAALFSMKGEVKSLGLEDIRPLSPENLMGSSGTFSGFFTYDSSIGKDPRFEMILKVREPGGNLQARFFSLLLPYLPTLPDKVRLAKLAGTPNEVVGFKESELRGTLERTDQFKIFFHILVPAYNLNLNLNLEVKLDEKNAFPQLARVMGLVKVRT